MKIKDIHPLDSEIAKFEIIQAHFPKKVKLESSAKNPNIKFCAGVDVAYWEELISKY